MGKIYDSMNSQVQEEVFEIACEDAYEMLVDELKREPTEDEITERAKQLIEELEPDWDLMLKDDLGE